MNPPKFWYIHELCLDQRLAQPVFDRLTDRARLERWGHMADIYRSGEDMDVSIVVDGGVWLQDVESADEILLAPGDIFGRLAREATGSDLLLEARRDTLLAVVSADQFREWVVPHLGRLETRVGLFYKRRGIWMPVEPMLFTPPKARLAKVLIHLVETHGAEDANGVGRLGLTIRPRKLVDLSGVDGHRVEQIIAELGNDEIVEINRGELVIVQPDALRKIAQSG